MLDLETAIAQYNANALRYYITQNQEQAIAITNQANTKDSHNGFFLAVVGGSVELVRLLLQLHENIALCDSTGEFTLLEILVQFIEQKTKQYLDLSDASFQHHHASLVPMDGVRPRYYSTIVNLFRQRLI